MPHTNFQYTIKKEKSQVLAPQIEALCTSIRKLDEVHQSKMRFGTKFEMMQFSHHHCNWHLIIVTNKSSSSGS